VSTLIPGPPTLPSPPDEVPPGWAHRGNAWKALALELEGSLPRYMQHPLCSAPRLSEKQVVDIVAKLAALARLP
jgi:hypothetical protein